MSFIRNWVERRAMRRKVDWRDCVWSPQKSAEKAWKESFVRRHMEIFRIQSEQQLRILAHEAEMGALLQEANRKLHAKAMQEYQHQYEIYRTRRGKE